MCWLCELELKWKTGDYAFFFINGEKSTVRGKKNPRLARRYLFFFGGLTFPDLAIRYILFLDDSPLVVESSTDEQPGEASQRSFYLKRPHMKRQLSDSGPLSQAKAPRDGEDGVFLTDLQQSHPGHSSFQEATSLGVPVELQDEPASCLSEFLALAKQLRGTVDVGKLSAQVKLEKVPAEALCPKDFCSDKFHVLGVFEIHNAEERGRFELEQLAMGRSAAASNERILFHATKGDLISVLNTGLDVGFAKAGFFGKGLYFSASATKANDYSVSKGCADAVRALLVCRVLCGRVKNFDLGTCDATLTTAPAGFDSVQGLLRRDDELVIYKNARVSIARVVFYKYSATLDELATQPPLPPTVKGKVVLITLPLSQFFSKLREKAKQLGGCHELIVKKHVSLLLTQQIDVAKFLFVMEQSLKSTAPAGLEAKIREELVKSNLTIFEPSKALSS